MILGTFSIDASLKATVTGSQFSRLNMSMHMRANYPLSPLRRRLLFTTGKSLIDVVASSGHSGEGFSPYSLDNVAGFNFLVESNILNFVPREKLKLNCQTFFIIGRFFVGMSSDGSAENKQSRYVRIILYN